MFVSGEGLKGIPCIEFQIPRKKPLFKNVQFMIPHFKYNSLYLNDKDISDFIKKYNTYFGFYKGTDSSSQYEWYDLNYITKERTEEIFERIAKEKPKDSEILIEWLNECVQESKGLYIIGHS